MQSTKIKLGFTLHSKHIDRSDHAQLLIRVKTTLVSRKRRLKGYAGERRLLPYPYSRITIYAAFRFSWRFGGRILKKLIVLGLVLGGSAFVELCTCPSIRYSKEAHDARPRVLSNYPGTFPAVRLELLQPDSLVSLGPRWVSVFCVVFFAFKAPGIYVNPWRLRICA
jgi:hypothetical protein